MPAMALLVRWQFDSCQQGDINSWWKDMRIETQLQCERALQYTGRGESFLYFSYENRTSYMIDLVLMTQQNLQTGCVRPLRRVEVQNFSCSENYFWKGELKWNRRSEPSKESRRDRDRRHG